MEDLESGVGERLLKKSISIMFLIYSLAIALANAVLNTVLYFSS